MVGREIFRLCHWSAGTPLAFVETYTCDSHENRDPVEIYVDISRVWDRHIQSLRCHRNFECPTVPDNTLIRVKTGRAITLGGLSDGRPRSLRRGPPPAARTRQTDFLAAIDPAG